MQAVGSAQRDGTVAPVTPTRRATAESLEEEVTKWEGKRERMLSRILEYGVSHL